MLSSQGERPSNPGGEVVDLVPRLRARHMKGFLVSMQPGNSWHPSMGRASSVEPDPQPPGQSSLSMLPIASRDRDNDLPPGVA